MSDRRGSGLPLRVLLVGPCPPPHGGISVHVATARRALREAGVPCRIVDSSGHRTTGGVTGAARSLARMMGAIDAHARRGYLTHVHTNGHSTASWSVALLAAVAAYRAPGRVLTLHSGILPEFVEQSGAAARSLVRFTAARYDRIVCVNDRVATALATLRVPRERLAVLPAHLVTPAATGALPESVERWISSRSPIVSSALFLRPEYGLDLLVEAAGRLKTPHPGLGWVVMGDGDDAALDAVRRQLAALDLDQRVLLTGDLPHDTCVALMARSDLYVRPARRDGDAISVREALALGVPVVASDAATRPAGTVLHRSGDADDLAARACAVLAARSAVLAARSAVLATDRSASRPRPGAGDGADGERGVDALLSIYRSACGAASIEPARVGRIGGRLSRLRAMFSRLRAMSGPEIAYRIRNAVRVELDRLPSRGREESDDAFLRGLVDADARSDSFLGHLREVVAERFYLPASNDERRATAELLWRHFPTSLSAAATGAERLCEHRVEVLGWGETTLGAEIDWHRDPVSGEVWPRRHFADYDTVADRDRDAKRVWELNRHQHLPRLGKAYLLSGEERYAREAVAQMLGWIEQNPIRSGVHWHSSLEIAFRALSWLWALFYVLPSAALDEASARRIGKSLFAQLDHVARYPSIWSSPNTHLLGEATALYVAGFLFRDGRRGRRWLELGKMLLEREAPRQILDDGMHAELSPYYHCYAADFYLQAIALGRRSEHALDEATVERVETMLDALRSLCGPDGVVPLLGDDDGGRVLTLGASTSYRDARDLLAAGVVLFGRGDWKAEARTLREEAFWLVGRGGWAAWEALPSAESLPERSSLDCAGYHVDTGGGAATRSLLLFDRGGLGKLGGGHGHADALSIVLRAHGEELLVDPGTGVYNAAPEWRAFFRSTRAHNTLTIDDADQSISGGTFRWARHAQTRSLGEGRHPSIRWAAAEHDGYVDATGLVHRRRLLSIDDGYWLVLDDVRAAGETGKDGDADGNARHERRARSRRPERRQLDLRWHFAPEAQVVLRSPDGAARSRGLDATARVGASSLHLRVEASAPVAARVVRGATAPAPQGWVSRRYGEKQPAPVLEARMVSSAPASFITLLAPASETRRGSLGAGAQSMPARVLDGDSGRATAVALAIPHARGEDLVILSSRGALVEAGPCRVRAEVFWVRVEDDRPTRLLALDATYVEVARRLYLQPDRLEQDQEPVARSAQSVARGAQSVHHFWSANASSAGARSSAVAPVFVEERKHVRYRGDR